MASSPPRRWRCSRRSLWAFHNAKSGLCFPSYERIAEAAGCARSTVAEALQGARGRGDPLMGPQDQAGARAMPGPAGRGRLALAGRCGRPTPTISRSRPPESS